MEIRELAKNGVAAFVAALLQVHQSTCDLQSDMLNKLLLQKLEIT